MARKPGSARNYVRGRAKEYRARDFLLARGYSVMRAAQSKGPADLLAGKALPGGFVKVLAVQVKGGGARFAPGGAARLVQFAAAFNAVPVLVAAPARPFTPSRKYMVGRPPDAPGGFTLAELEDAWF